MSGLDDILGSLTKTGGKQSGGLDDLLGGLLGGGSGGGSGGGAGFTTGGSAGGALKMPFISATIADTIDPTMKNISMKSRAIAIPKRLAVACT